MKILAHNPGHDGAFAFIRDAKLMMSIEAEKDSNARYSAISVASAFTALGELEESPDVICTGGWWHRDHFEYLRGSDDNAGYRGVGKDRIIARTQPFLGRQVQYFSSSHERSHILCAFGMSRFPKGTRCYALIWEGAIGAFYDIDDELNIELVGDVLSSPGNRYGLLYGLADPTFPKNGPFPRVSDAGKLMALASFSNRNTPTDKERDLLAFLLEGPFREWSAYGEVERAPYFNVGVRDPEFCNFAGIYSDALFDKFYQFARTNLKEAKPLLVVGGCGLNCDWNSKWKDCGLFTDVFVPPVANDSGSAIGTALDAQLYFTGNPKISWSVYSGRSFVEESCDLEPYDLYDADYDFLADLLANDLILGWVSGRCEIGPRALGNRSILAEPFRQDTRVRLNDIKQREQFRPIAPVCLEEDAVQWFGCDHGSPFMLYTYRAKTDALAAVTHVNGTARIQTVSSESNNVLYRLLTAFKVRTGFGVLCNTSLNFHGRGFINRMRDLSAYTSEHKLDGFAIEGRAYLLKCSQRYRDYLKRTDGAAGMYPLAQK